MTALLVLLRSCPGKYCPASSLQKRKEKKSQPFSSECVYLRMFFNCLLGNIIKVIKGSKELPHKDFANACEEAGKGPSHQARLASLMS